MASSSSKGASTLSEVRVVGLCQYIFLCPPSPKDARTYVPDATSSKRALGLRRPSCHSYSPECVENGFSRKFVGTAFREDEIRRPTPHTQYPQRVCKHKVRALTAQEGGSAHHG